MSDYVTVADLRVLLDSLPDDLPVVLQKDAEGNGYSPLEGAARAHYTPDSAWSGETHHAMDYTPEDYPDAIPVLVLWPVN